MKTHPLHMGRGVDDATRGGEGERFLLLLTLRKVLPGLLRKIADAAAQDCVVMLLLPKAYFWDEEEDEEEEGIVFEVKVEIY